MEQTSKNALLNWDVYARHTHCHSRPAFRRKSGIFSGDGVHLIYGMRDAVLVDTSP